MSTLSDAKNLAKNILLEAINNHSYSSAHLKDNAANYILELSSDIVLPWANCRLLFCLAIEIKYKIVDKNILLSVIGNIPKDSIVNGNMHRLFAEELRLRGLEKCFSNLNKMEKENEKYGRVLTKGQLDTSGISFPNPEDSNLRPEEFVFKTWPMIGTRKCNDAAVNQVFWITPVEKLVEIIHDVTENSKKVSQTCNYLGLYKPRSIFDNDKFFVYIQYPHDFHSNFECVQPSLLQRNWNFESDYFLSNKDQTFGLTFNVDCQCMMPAKERIHDSWNSPTKTEIDLEAYYIGEVDVNHFFGILTDDLDNLASDFLGRFN